MSSRSRSKRLINGEKDNMVDFFNAAMKGYADHHKSEEKILMKNNPYCTGNGFWMTRQLWRKTDKEKISPHFTDEYDTLNDENQERCTDDLDTFLEYCEFSFLSIKPPSPGSVRSMSKIDKGALKHKKKKPTKKKKRLSKKGRTRRR